MLAEPPKEDVGIQFDPNLSQLLKKIGFFFFQRNKKLLLSESYKIKIWLYSPLDRYSMAWVGFLLITGWPVNQGPVFLVPCKNGLSSLRHCTRMYTLDKLIFPRYLKNTAMINWSHFTWDPKWYCVHPAGAITEESPLQAEQKKSKIKQRRTGKLPPPPIAPLLLRSFPKIIPLLRLSKPERSFQ